MSLRFVYGRAGFGKSSYCLDDIAEAVAAPSAAASDKPLILIVPEQFSYEAERNLSAVIKTDAEMRARVLSFKRLGYRVLAEVGGLKREHLSKAGRAMLIYRIMNEVKGELEIFSKSALHAGFVQKISELVAELKRYAVTPEMLIQAAENTKETLTKRKLHDISLIFERYENQIHISHIDAEDDMDLLCDKLDQSTYLDGAELYFDGFTSFTPQQYKIIAKLMRKASRINVSLSMARTSGKSDLFALTLDTERRLVDLARDAHIMLDEPIWLEERSRSRFQTCPDLAHLEQHLYTFPFKEYEGSTENICLFKAMNGYLEIEELAKDISRLIREGGKNLRYKDIAVATRDLPRYESLIRAVFSSYEIPFFIDERRELLGNPLIIMIGAMLEIPTRNWSYEAVFRYLKSGVTGISGDDINLIENYVLACGIKGSRWFEESWETRLEYGLQSEKEDIDSAKEYFDRLNGIKAMVVDPLRSFFSKLKSATTCREFCTLLYEFLRENGVDQRLESSIEEFKKNDDMDNANKYTQVWNIAMQVLDQTVEILGEEKLSVDEFAKLINIGFSQYTAGLIPSSVDQVVVGNVDRMRSHDVKALYVIGVNDGVFPKAQNDEGILNDKDRDELMACDIELSSGTRAKAFEEQFVIYSTLSSASCRLYISYPMADHEGKTLRPSIVISRMKRLFPKLVEYGGLTQVEEACEQVWAPVPSFNGLVAAMRNKLDGMVTDPFWDKVYEWYSSNITWSARADRILDGLAYNNQAAAIDAERARKLYGKDLLFSVSRLEKYAECPFAYFVKYGLKAKERKIYSATAPDLGTFMHNVLSRFSDLLRKEEQSWREVDKSFCADAVGLLVDDMVEAIPGSILQSSKRYEFLAERLKRTLSTAVYIIAEQIKRSEFDPIGYEEGFGPRDKYPPIQIVLENGEEINLIGRIDRVDLMDTGESQHVRIIDYKSGNKDLSLTDVYYGLQLQLLTYLDAILEGAASDPQNTISLSPAGILYFRLDDPIIKGNPEITDEQIELLMIKELKFRGLLIDDIDIIKGMDRDLQGTSDILPVRVNVDQTLSRSSRVATSEQFELLRRHVKKTITELSESMLNGRIKINPYKKKSQSACTYCEYSSICQFDTTIQDNSYRLIKEQSNDDIWSKMQQELGVKEQAGTGGSADEYKQLD